MKRLPQIGIELNIGITTLLEYCLRLERADITKNSKIDPQLEQQIIALHKDTTTAPEIIENEKSKILIIQELSNDFNISNPFHIEQQNIINQTNQFSNRQKRTISFQDSKTETIFSDFEANSICLGLDNKRAKHLARNYFKKNEQLGNEQIEVHLIAMSALEKYGAKTLSFVISLPPLPFNAVDATQIFSELDKRRKKQDLPTLRITFKNDKNQTEKIKISYYAEKTDYGYKRNDNILMIRNTRTSKNLMRISRSGIVIPENNAKQIIPVLQLFIRFSKDTKQTLINYGLETGECSLCGRKLTVCKSIRIGMGPICRQY